MVCGGDEVCNDDFHIRQELVNTRDSRFLFQQTYAINATNDVGIGWCFEASFASALSLYLLLSRFLYPYLSLVHSHRY
jgi:hypothetical protein